MTTVVLYPEAVEIPSWINDLPSFRRWYHSDEFPETGRICFLAGRMWVDMSKEQVFTHNQVKHEFALVLGGLVKQARLGRYFPDGLLVTNLAADLSCQPDGTFVSRVTLRSDRVRLVGGTGEGFLELEGAPDMVLEVGSPSSVAKDTVSLPDLYWRAGVPEYWLVDARSDVIRFDILRHGRKGYTATRKQRGWVRSQVFGRSFRLIRTVNESGNPEFTLEMRSEAAVR